MALAISLVAVWALALLMGALAGYLRRPWWWAGMGCGALGVILVALVDDVVDRVSLVYMGFFVITAMALAALAAFAGRRVVRDRLPPALPPAP